ncbi:aminoglycoside 2''-phosphotransferase [Deinococcus sp. HSC-46F16]|uniref:phosphotransferase family protein n=1 Tax=Deinococcus sp. HSC-46F16 TaxID=2910968 RepID=UPI0020A00E3A|nr:phosphotransferase [Deinococcus sp. HSC-46F16]MCP2014320.1 aminoglycoside 2''-phosphotransferase [Deinococcus sp. HSC-46F16]
MSALALPQPYLDRIRSRFPALPLRELEFNQDGLVNDVVVVGGDLVCRFPKHDWAPALLRQEARVLELARRHVTLAVPRFEVLEEDFAAYQFLPGEPLTRTRLLRLSGRARRAALTELLTFLQQLHAVPQDEVEAAGVGPSDATRTREDWLAFAGEVEDALFPLLMRHQREAFREVFGPVRSGALDLSHTPRLIHGDLGVYHVLFDPGAGRLSGVIDFGTAGLGDPALDLAVLLGNYGESLVAPVLPTYPELGDHLDRARFWVGTLEWQWALAGVVGGRTEFALAHLGGARDVLPTGSSRD